jgi:hypothetical protein
MLLDTVNSGRFLTVRVGPISSYHFFRACFMPVIKTFPTPTQIMTSYLQVRLPTQTTSAQTHSAQSISQVSTTLTSPNRPVKVLT